jgi:hypothetical protein
MQATAAGGVFQAVPSLLRSLDRWISWLPFESKRADGTPKTDKVPDYPWKNPRFWLGWAALEERISVSQSRPGFVFDGPVPVTGGWLFALDLDACRDPLTGEIAPWAVAVGLRCEWSYTEVTPSGTGLRVWVIVKEKPSRWGRQHFTPLGVDVPKRGKKPECQPFGASKLSFVAVTGQRLLESADEVKVIESFDWWPAIFGVTCDAGAVEASAVGTGSAALGEEPEVEEIRARVESEPHGKDLLGADWQGWLERPAGENGTAPPASGSEAYFRLVQLVLRACRGHAGAAVKFLLRETTWGRGGEGIGEKYQRAGWVESEVARVEAKTGAGARASGSVFEPLNDNPERPHSLSDGVVGAPGANAKPKEGPRLLGVEAFVRAAGSQMFLVKNLIARAAVTQFYGDPASGKTPFVLSLAIAVASGQTHWFGHKIMRHGVVVYMVGEDRTGVGHRVQAQLKAMGLSAKDVEGRLFFTDRPGQLLDAGDVAKWVRLIQETAGGQEVVLVVVDTQAQNFGPGDENDFEDMNRFVHNVERMTEVLDASMTLVHHMGHANKERGRGHSAMDGALASRFEVVATESEDGGPKVTVARDRKHKNWAEPEALRAALVPVELYRDAEGDPVTAITLREMGTEVFAEADRRRRLLTAVAAGHTSERALAAEMGGSRRMVRSLMVTLVQAGLLTKLGRNSYGLTPAGVRAISRVVHEENAAETPLDHGPEKWTNADHSLLE